MQVQPYLSFEGRCEEALTFYRDTIGAEVTALMRVKDAPPDAQQENCSGPTGNGDKVLHANFQVGDTQVMASDGMCSGNAAFQGFALTLTVASDDEAADKFGQLSAGGEVTMPLAPTFFASQFGMLRDRFGVEWIVINPLPMP